MSKRLIIIHGYNDNPNMGWMSWLTTQAQQLGYSVLAPKMPHSKIPNIDVWLRQVSNTVKVLDNQTILLGHSLGTFVLLKFLSQYQGSESEKARALILVSGFLDPGYAEAKAFFEPRPNIENILKRVSKTYSIYSDNDKLVKPQISAKLADELGSEQICLHSQGHFLNRDTQTIPQLLEIIQNIQN